MQIKKYKILLIILSLFIFSGCYQKQSVGEEDEVLILADDYMFKSYKSQINRVLSDSIETPVPEKRFNFKRVNYNEFPVKKIYKNILLLGNIDRDSPESKFINQFLSHDIKNGIREGKYFFIIQENLWARNQTVFFLLDSENKHLENHLETHGAYVLNKIIESHHQIIKKRLFSRFGNKKAREHINKNYGFDMVIPPDFEIVNEQKNPNFVRFRRKYPDRWLTIIWDDYNPDYNFQNNAINLRNKAGSKFGDSVKINQEIIKFKTDTLFNANGTLIEGIWEYQLGGGPFFTHAFLHGNTMYLIDGAVFAPERKKIPFIDQLKIMAKTFKFSYK